MTGPNFTIKSNKTDTIKNHKQAPYTLSMLAQLDWKCQEQMIENDREKEH